MLLTYFFWSFTDQPIVSKQTGTDSTDPNRGKSPTDLIILDAPNNSLRKGMLQPSWWPSNTSTWTKCLINYLIKPKNTSLAASFPGPPG